MQRGAQCFRCGARLLHSQEIYLKSMLSKTHTARMDLWLRCGSCVRAEMNETTKNWREKKKKNRNQQSEDK